jgi:hypothetical protein
MFFSGTEVASSATISIRRNMNTTFPLSIPARHRFAYSIPELPRVSAVAAERVPGQTRMLSPKRSQSSGSKSRPAKARRRVRRFNPPESAMQAHAVLHREHAVALVDGDSFSPADTFVRGDVLPRGICHRGGPHAPVPTEHALADPVQSSTPQVRVCCERDVAGPLSKSGSRLPMACIDFHDSHRTGATSVCRGPRVR